MKRVLIVEDHPLMRESLSRMLTELSICDRCEEVGSAATALTAMRESAPDLAIVDLALPGTDGLELIKLMLAERPALPILVLSMHDESVYALRALRAGARGYAMKAQPVKELVEAIHRVAGGEVYVSPEFSERMIFQAVQAPDGEAANPVRTLSDRELEVLRLLGRGIGVRQIAARLNLSVKTIETHRSHIKEKLKFHSAKEVMQFAVDWLVQQSDGAAEQSEAK